MPLNLDFQIADIKSQVMSGTLNLEENKNIGFLYMNFINLYENGDNFNYGNYISKGYSSYYTEKYNNNWVYGRDQRPFW